MQRNRTPIPEYTNSVMKSLILEYIHDETNQKILFMRLIKGKTFSDIAEAFGLDDKTVRNRIHKNEEILFKHLPQNYR